jgi:rare lipoprotein A
VVKIGEQSPASGASPSRSLLSSAGRPAIAIAKVHAHAVDGRKAATLYVRNIPVLTFLGAPIQDISGPSPEVVKLGAQSDSLPVKHNSSSTDSGSTDSSSTKSLSSVAGQPALLSQTTDTTLVSTDPVERASAMAATLNTLNRAGMDATQITVSLDEAKALLEGDRFVIKVGTTALAILDRETKLPDSTQNRQQDALQATNRLRRLLGDAAPLPQVAFSGNSPFSPDYGAVKSTLQGWASWYGPGFNGNMSASGEIFNQNDLTAAHRTLPFGTRVKVTNMDNGTSVLVRITDRGPYAGDRILDLSMGAARVLGLIQSGVAPVRLDIMDRSAVVGSR